MNLLDRNQKQREFFNEKINTYDDVHKEFMETKIVLAENLDKNTKNILDLGAGTGLELIHVFEMFPDAKVTVIDISENMLEELKKRAFADKVNIICGDFFKTDFGKGNDAVISTSALHHFMPVEKLTLYRKILESLRDGGLFINADKISLSQEEQDFYLKELENNFANYKHLDTPLTVENEIKILKEVGFDNVETASLDRDDYALFKARKRL